MKYRHVLPIFSIFIICILFASSTVFAIGTPTSTKKQATLVGTVNIQNAKIISQVGNVFNISFEFSNREMIQSGVKYGVKLISKDKAGIQSLVDEKIYDESITLPENSITKKTITYTAPNILTGTYSLVLFSSNNSGFSFGTSFVKEVNLEASVKGLEIVTNSCYLKVEGDKNNIHYALLQNVDISKDESLRLTCNTINHGNDALSLTPSFETRYRSAYGDVAPETRGDNMAISFGALKNDNFSILLPKGTTPQVYNVNIKLVNGSIASNSVSAQYVIRGMNATIANLSLDKDYYKRGDKALLSLIVISSSQTDKFIRGNNGNISNKNLSINTQITNENGLKCATPLTQNFVRNTINPKVEIPVMITSSCLNPHVSLSIKDASGGVLDHKDFIFTSTSVPQHARPSSSAVLIVAVLLVLIIIISVYMKKKNKTKTVLPALLFIIGLGVVPFHHASADQYYAGANVEVTVNLDTGITYSPNDIFRITGTLTELNGIPETINMNVVAGGVLANIFDPQTLYGTIYKTIANISGATANPGTFNADFSVGVDEAIPPGASFTGGSVTSEPTQGGTGNTNVVCSGVLSIPSTNPNDDTVIFNYHYTDSNHVRPNGSDSCTVQVPLGQSSSTNYPGVEYFGSDINITSYCFDANSSTVPNTSNVPSC